VILFAFVLIGDAAILYDRFLLFISKTTVECLITNNGAMHKPISKDRSLSCDASPPSELLRLANCTMADVGRTSI